ncbi:MAG: phosphodiester glycosidase family protein [Pyrinomonadaceae bacterium]
MPHQTSIPTHSRFVRSAFLVFLCSLCFYVVEIHAQEFKTLKDGIEYAEVTKEISGLKVNMNLLRLDLKKVRLDVHHALDAAIGTEKTSSIATRHGAFAAINAGFFRLDTSIWAGDAVGILMIDGKLLSESSQDRTVLKISNVPETSVEIVAPKTKIFFRQGTREIEISGINRELKNDELVLFKPEFQRTTLTGFDVKEVAIEKGEVVHMSASGNTLIPSAGVVLSASGARRTDLLALKIGDKVTLGERFEPVPGRTNGPMFLVRTVEDMVTGVPQLIKDAKIDITWEQEKSSKSFVETRHPRTAVAKLKDGKFLMITVDGRSELSGGIGLQDLAEYLLELGATDAMNLDGGGSTTMFVDGKVVNHPSDKEGERKVSDALLVTLRTPAKIKK